MRVYLLEMIAFSTEERENVVLVVFIVEGVLNAWLFRKSFKIYGIAQTLLTDESLVFRAGWYTIFQKPHECNYKRRNNVRVDYVHLIERLYWR